MFALTGLTSVYATEAVGTQAQENAAYITMLETLRSTGQPATGAAAFAYTDAATNTALYDPYGAALRTVAAAQGLDLCVTVLGTGTAVANFATGTTVETALEDPNATTAHTNAIASAPASAGVVGGVLGGSLVSIGLPLLPVTGIPAPATPYTPEPATAAWIAGIEAFAITTALTFNPADDIQRRLLGEPRDSELLADAVWHELTGFWGVQPDDILHLEAQFGIYGSLPVLVVYFDDSYILIDATTGLVSGPFLDTQPFDPVPLLEAHAEYEPGTGARMVIGESGCETQPWGPRWRIKPPGNDYQPIAPIQPPPNPRPYFVPPTKPDDWNRPHYPYNIPGVRRPYPVPQFPQPAVPGPGTYTNPGTLGNPTDWSCAPATSDGGQTVEFCSTIEEFCDPNGNCVPRLITCVFDNGPLGDPPNRGNTPPNPGVDYPGWPTEITDLDGKPTGDNENNCIDRWFY